MPFRVAGSGPGHGVRCLDPVDSIGKMDAILPAKIGVKLNSSCKNLDLSYDHDLAKNVDGKWLALVI